MEKDITHRPSYQSINNCDSQRSKSPPGSTETVSVYSNQILLAISEFHTEISAYCMIPPPSPPQGALPAFDRLEDIEGSQINVKVSEYHNGGVPTPEQINTDEIINAIGYGPLQVCQGRTQRTWKWSSTWTRAC